MWVKIDKNYNVLRPPVNDGNHFNVDKDEKWLLENGYEDLTQEEINERIDISSSSSVEVGIKKYSTYKLAEALSNAGLWETFKSQLTDMEYTYFSLASYLSSDDENFKSAIERFSGVEGANQILSSCEIDE